MGWISDSFPQKIDSYRARNTNTIVKHTEVVIDRHVAGAWPRARFGHKFTKALRHEFNC